MVAQRLRGFVAPAALRPADFPLTGFFFAAVRARFFFGTLDRLSIGTIVPSGNLAETTSSPPSA